MKAFAGIAVCQRKVQPRKVVKGGVWLNEATSPEQKKAIRAKAEKVLSGNIAIRETERGDMTVTTIAFVGRLPDTKAARQATIAIAKIVEEVTGIRSALVELPDYHAVTTALHCA